MIYDIFVSYRRVGGHETAKHLNDLLCRDGYSVSFDIDTLREGRFDTALLARIEQCADFVLVVDKHCFDRTLDNSVKPEEDWLRSELAYALRLKKNIIPVLLSGATFPSGLPEDISEVSRMNGPTYSVEYFDNFYEKLKKMLHALPRNRVVQGGTQPVMKHPNLKVTVDLDCVMSIDGEVYGSIVSGRLQKIPLPEGEYMLRFESVENGSDFMEMAFNMPDKDKLYRVELLRVKLEREQREREEQERKEAERREMERKEREARGEIEVRGVKFKMVYVEGGTFTMGATTEQGSDADGDEKPAHKVKLSDYYIGETAVTQGLWKAVMGSEPTDDGGWTEEYGKGENYPAYSVSYDDVDEFIKKLNRETGRTFRLPTEAEWEYAARGGNRSKGYKYSGSNSIDEVAWYGGNSGDKTHPVKGRRANELGLYDMSGNGLEWCADWFGDYSSEEQTDPQGPDSGADRVLRGGGWCWYFKARYCRVSNRDCTAPTSRGNNLSFRLVLCP